MMDMILKAVGLASLFLAFSGVAAVLILLGIDALLNDVSPQMDEEA